MYDNWAGGKYAIFDTFQRGKNDYTQGFYYSPDLKIFIQSTGVVGFSKIMLNELDLENKKFTTKKFEKIDNQYFGEGCELIGGFIYQLIWTKKKILVYDKELKKIKEVDFPPNAFSEGWGITHSIINGTTLAYVSDGSAHIYECTIDKATHEFKIQRKILIKKPFAQAYTQINELEFIKGSIYANIYMTNTIIKIDPESGHVVKEYRVNELQSLAKKDRESRFGRTLFYDECLNGIAYIKEEKMFYLTGKNWGLVFKIQLDYLE